MSVRFNHTIVWCSDKWRSAEFLAQMLGRQPPVTCGAFQAVHLDNDVSLRFGERAAGLTPQHYAFCVSERELDAVLARIDERGAAFWSDPARKHKGQIHHDDGGRGIYFEDPDGHLLEVITRPQDE